MLNATMVWLNDGGVAMPADPEEIKCGKMRSTMKTNVLIDKPEIGQVKKSSFVHDKPGTIYGMPSPHDGESAKEVTLNWSEHVPSAQKPVGPDFKTMNKLAAMSGVTSPKEVATFRQSHSVSLKRHEPKASSPRLPSDEDAAHVYGMPSAHRSPESVRNNGPEEPKMKHLVQGAYQHEWVYQNIERAAGQTSPKKVVGKDTVTKATLGHAMGAAAVLAGPGPEDVWIMTKFGKVQPKVTQYMGK